MTPDRRTTGTAVALALPGLVLAAAGLLHPHYLVIETAPRWTMLHVVALFVFPLVGVALAVLVRGRTDPVAWLVRLTAFVYAAAYTALDVISGIAAGYVTWRLGENVVRPDEVRYLFAIGGRLGETGSWALLAATVAVAADALWRHRVAALPGLLLAPGAVLVHLDHIFAPRGVAGMALIGLGTGLLALVVLSPARRPASTARRPAPGSRAGRG
ncbi:hypothetical protein [uncultured Nocardioides sp.]|uniref:hypothetical protein n=1 Tax=uncultured Nocardioides sp. TaxID=198441 RepID=UPI0025EF1D35|nr:hypothetical protein [uncultured Nocardioides sp.]